MYYILAIFIFGVLIAVHEFGHFIAAKLCGVRVNEFAIGMGPAIWKKQGGETLYALRILPIGGFCAMEGEDDDSDDPRAFGSQSYLKRFIILVAGSAMNFLLGLVVVLCVFAPTEGFSSPVITSFMDDCPYESSAGLQLGDELYKINGERIYTSSDVVTYLDRNGGSSLMDIVVIRNGEKLEINDFNMVRIEYEGEAGLKFGLRFENVESGFGALVKYSWYACMDFARMVWLGLSDLVTGGVNVKEMAGVVGIVDLMNTVGEGSDTVGLALQNIFYLTAFIAVNLAVMNLLPIPALDGGRVFFLIITGLVELVAHKKLNPKYEGYVNAVGLVLLMGLMVFVMFNDIVRIISG